MSVSVFVDPHRNAAILVCDDPIHALGPVLVADDPNEAVEAMEAFIGALERPADELSTIQVITEWTGFLAALHGMVMGEGGELVQPNGDPQDHATGDEFARDIPGASTPEAPPQPADADEGAEGGETVAEMAAGLQEGAEAPEQVEQPDDEADEDLDLADRLRHIPGGTPAQRGETDCWNCGGSGWVNIAGEDQTCGVCGGKGRLPSAS